MALASGTRLGPYEILAPLGAGGMGEVYRARDTKLDRDIALKSCPRASPKIWSASLDSGEKRSSSPRSIIRTSPPFTASRNRADRRFSSSRPAWARNGRELFYIDAAATLMSVSVQTTGSTFTAGNPARVFDTKYAWPLPFRTYDVSPDGQRFLMIKDGPTDEKATPASIVVVERWFEELRQRVPAR